MLIRILFILSFIVTNTSFASEFADHPSDKMITRSRVVAAVRALTKDCAGGNIDLPDGMTLKAADLQLSLKGCYKYYSATNGSLNHREIHLNVMSAAPGRRNQKVGSVFLVEKPGNTGPDGQFSLHFIGIDDAYQGRSYGSTALDLTILLTQRLARHSSFYDRLTLQCADYDGENHLGNVPYRLSYYLNHGFHLDAETISYMRHLDLGHFTHSMGVEEFTAFLNSYSDGQWGTVSVPLASFTDRAEELLGVLKTTHTQNPFLLDKACLEIAESSSSDAGQCIINRLFYDRSLDDNGYETRCAEMIYLMHLNVHNWSQAIQARRALKAERATTEAVLKHDPSELNRLLIKIAHIHLLLTRPPLAEITLPESRTPKRKRSEVEREEIDGVENAEENQFYARELEPLISETKKPRPLP